MKICAFCSFRALKDLVKCRYRIRISVREAAEPPMRQRRAERVRRSRRRRREGQIHVCVIQWSGAAEPRPLEPRKRRTGSIHVKQSQRYFPEYIHEGINVGNSRGARTPPAQGRRNEARARGGGRKKGGEWGRTPRPPGAQAHEREGRAQPLYRPRKPCARPGSERPEGAAGALAQGFAPAKIPHERSELRRLWQGMRSTLATLRKIRAPGGRRAPLKPGSSAAAQVDRACEGARKAARAVVAAVPVPHQTAELSSGSGTCRGGGWAEGGRSARERSGMKRRPEEPGRARCGAVVTLPFPSSAITFYS